MRNRILSSTLAIAWGVLSSRAAVALPAQEPLFLVSDVKPMVMFAMSVDHQLFMKAFADYSDLNGDGRIDNTYTDTFDYYGYFDSKRCYAYNSGSGYYEPKNLASGANLHHCNNTASDGDWSGNFLNWATMTRIDVLRKALYGGKRSVDSTSATVLERELLPFDVHSFVKVFTPDAGDSMANYLPTSFGVAPTVSLCNSTPPPTSGSDQTQSMSTATNPPKVRIARGDWGRWAADEVIQCEWRNNGVSPGTSQNLFSANSTSAPNVRVKVCESGKLETNCKVYNASTAAKPTGLLQDYGEDGELRFGLVSGSYVKRDKGGVLRKGISQLAGNAVASTDEVNLTNGTFNTGVNGIISTLDKIRLTTWDYSQRKYLDCAIFGIPISSYLSASQIETRGGTNYDATCSNWGNPISELYLEAVRYMIGEGSPTTAFDVTTDSLSLPSATWTDPMPSTEWCTPMNVVVIASGDNSFDTDHLGTVPTVLGSINTATDTIGTEEALSGNVFIGEVGSTPSASPDSNTCSAKAFTNLSQMRGLCPATPQKQGGYAISGIAFKAHTTDLRTAAAYKEEQTINTYAIAMAKSLPDFVFDIGGRKVSVVPNGYASFDSGGSWRASSLAHLNVESTEYDVNGKLVYARFLAHWEDSAWGNDYDMDVISRVSVCVGAACTTHDDDGSGANDANPGAGNLRVTVRAIHKFSGAWMRVGFVISGTTADGVYSGVQQGATQYTSFDDDPGRDGSENTPATQVFTPGAGSATSLPTPLQYAAKYGSFNDSNNNNLPDVQTEWDEDGDGIADSYFFADDPSQIGPKLASYLSTIATKSSSSSVVANSVSLQTTTRLYQARFDSTDWSGSVVSLKVDTSTGAVDQLNPDWDVAEKVKLQNYDTGREWITWDSTLDVNGDPIGGVPFRWASLNAAQQAALNLNPGSGLADGFGSQRLEYLRGNRFYELSQGNTAVGTPAFRDRVGKDASGNPEIHMLGDVVNSTPIVVGAPNFNYPDTLETVAYSTFKTSNSDVECFDASGNPRSINVLDREPILYFGSNDGALHGVSACTGQERIAYVPGGTYATLNQLTSPNYQHKYYVDGPVNVIDAFFGGAWHTVLIGTQGAGGSGIFALDVTDPSVFNESGAGNVALWDIQASPTVSGSDFEELGYAFSQPSIVKAKVHGWVAIFGNGYHGKSGKAVLYIVRLSDGQLLRSIDLSVDASGNPVAAHGANNGLSTPAPVDTDGDGQVDLIYAGDLNGNVWRFAADNNNGFLRANTTLLYKAKNASGVNQKITARVAVGYHPTYAKGRIVYFGTGKYYELTDQDPATAVVYNTMYGIWDRDDGNQVTSVTSRNSNVLQQQTITSTPRLTFGSNIEDVRIVSDTPVQWAGPNSSIPAGVCTTGQSCGWYLDLTDSGEKAVQRPILRGGRLIFVTTTPSPVPCEQGGSGWLMEIDPYTGGRLKVPVLDLNGDGLFDILDMQTISGNPTGIPPSGTKSKIGIIQNPAILSGFADGSFQTKNISGSKQATIDVKKERPDIGGVGRKSWVRIK
ncbi:MAG: hypothetical protein KDJ27_21350 [Gammaproteobacteria bacterium]|nr:hypothetical protein [Gammaproteobacteria bacterium]